MGWAKAYRELIALLYSGMIPLGCIKIRPAGARLKLWVRHQDPDPLVDLFKFTVRKFEEAKGRKLFPIECHDIMCKVGEVVVVGGVRRSALISLSNLNDDQMRHAKLESGGVQMDNVLANNSVAYKGNLMETYMREWLLCMSQSLENVVCSIRLQTSQVLRMVEEKLVICGVQILAQRLSKTISVL